MRLSDMINSALQQEDVQVVTGKSAQNYLINKQIRALLPGQIIKGEILSKDGSQIHVKVDENFILNAKLDSNIALSTGKYVLFQVKNNGSLLSLSPLFENTASDENILKALDMASLPLNEETASMTGLMMKEGMSIDKQSLQQVYRDVVQNKDAAIMDIITLHKLNVPVSAENITQLSAYSNLEHQLTSGMNQMIDSVPEMLQNMVENGKTNEAFEMLKQLVSLTSTAGNTDISFVSTLEGEAFNVGTQDTSAAQMIQNSLSQEIMEHSSANQSELTTESALNKASVDNNSAAILQSNGIETASQSQAEALTNSAIVESQVDKSVINTALNLLNSMDWSKDNLDENLHKNFSDLIKNSDFLKEFLSGIKDNWTLRPEEFNKENMERIYDNLSKQLENLSKVISSIGERNSNTASNIQNLQQNVNFLNQMNQMYSYIQIPLKLRGNETHGELYVYSNKKNLSTASGQVSALLHLDMDHLGPLDVHVTLQNTKVNTKFYVKDDTILDLIQEKIQMLNDGLDKLGYQMQCEMKVRESSENEHGKNTILNEILQENSVGDNIATYSFDVRA